LGLENALKKERKAINTSWRKGRFWCLLSASVTRMHPKVANLFGHAIFLLFFLSLTKIEFQHILILYIVKGKAKEKWIYKKEASQPAKKKRKQRAKEIPVPAERQRKFLTSKPIYNI